MDVADVAVSTGDWSGAELEGIVIETGMMAIKRAIACGLAPTETFVMQAELSQAAAAISAKRQTHVLRGVV